MRVAVVAGPDPGHTFPAVALCLRLRAAGEHPVLLTGRGWLARTRAEGLEVHELPDLAPGPGEDDTNAGQRLHARSARMSTPLVPLLRELAVDLVVADVLTACGGMAAERAGIPWVELNPHPLYLPSRGLPPLGSGLAVGTGLRGRARDAALRTVTAPAIRLGRRQRAAARVGVGLPEHDPGPVARLVATLPALEVPRPDWPSRAHVVGPLLWDPAVEDLEPPPGDDPLVFLSASTAASGTRGLFETAVGALRGVRLVCTTLPGAPLPPGVPPWVAVGSGRQAPLLARARVTVCGGGNGILCTTLSAGVPTVLVPGGGDQWELARRAERQGSGVVVRPLGPEALAAAVQRVLDEPERTVAAGRAATSAASVADPVAICRSAVR